jgi:pilus assembly protein CpaB
MFRGRGASLILVSLVLAGAAAFVATRWMSARAAALEASRPGLVRVAVAAIEIPFGTKVEARHLSTIEMLAGTHPGDAYLDPAEVVGKVAKATILSGELLLKPRFVEQGAGSTLAAVVSPNMRAVSIRVDDVVGVGGFLLPGNRVDVVASHERDGKAFAETILSDVKVLAVDQSASADKNEPVVVRAVTLEVTPEGAETMMKSRELGRLQLTLRNPLDESVVARHAPEPAPQPAVAARPAPRPVARVAAPAETPAPTVQVIRGTSVAGRTGS